MNKASKKSVVLSFCIFTLLALSSCGINGYIKFTKQEDFSFSKGNIESYFDSVVHPKVILKVPENSWTTEDEGLFYSVYYTIERELLLAGFDVRDRDIYKQVIKSASNLSYSKLREITDTDIVIELINLDYGVEYTTNIYYTNSGKERVMSTGNATDFGASVEFRVTYLESNDISGIYKFNYTPCTEGCTYTTSKYSRYSVRRAKEDQPFELIERNIFAEFIANSTKQLIAEMKP